MPPLHIKKAEPADSENLLALNVAFNGPGLTTAENITRSLLYNTAETVYIAYWNGQPAGFVCGRLLYSLCYALPHGEISELFVSPAFRRNGIGRALLSIAEQEFFGKGAFVITLGTSLQNKTAQAFYRGCGYNGNIKYIFSKGK